MQDFSELTPAEARELSLTPPPETPTPVASVEDAIIGVPGADIPLRIYRPGGDATGGALVYFHGGGWVIGDLDSHDEVCRRLCRDADVTVVSVYYRLAPETRFPGAMDDCYHATAWVADNAERLGIDAARIGVGGDSAGGNLAAAVALRARDEQGPQLAHQLLIYPVTNAEFDTGSYLENADGYLLTRRAMIWFWDHYVPSPNDRDHPYVAPLKAAGVGTGLEDLPPALVQTAEYDPLRDEGEAYAAALAAAGVPTQHTRYDGLIHGYFGMQDMMSPAVAAFAEAVSSLRTHLGQPAN